MKIKVKLPKKEKIVNAKDMKPGQIGVVVERDVHNGDIVIKTAENSIVSLYSGYLLVNIEKVRLFPKGTKLILK